MYVIVSVVYVVLGVVYVFVGVISFAIHNCILCSIDKYYELEYSFSIPWLCYFYTTKYPDLPEVFVTHYTNMAFGHTACSCAVR